MGNRPSPCVSSMKSRTIAAARISTRASSRSASDDAKVRARRSPVCSGGGPRRALRRRRSSRASTPASRATRLVLGIWLRSKQSVSFWSPMTRVPWTRSLLLVATIQSPLLLSCLSRSAGCRAPEAEASHNWAASAAVRCVSRIAVARSWPRSVVTTTTAMDQTFVAVARRPSAASGPLAPARALCGPGSPWLQRSLYEIATCARRARLITSRSCRRFTLPAAPIAFRCEVQHRDNPTV